MKSKMTSVLKEFEDLAWNVNTKRSWMKSITKSKELFPTNPSAVAIHPVITLSNIVPQPSRLPKYVDVDSQHFVSVDGVNGGVARLGSPRKGRKKHTLHLTRTISGNLINHPDGSPESRSPEGKLVFGEFSYACIEQWCINSLWIL